MKGLLWKDFYMVKKYCKAFLFIVIVFAAAAAFNPENNFFLVYPIILTSVIPITLLSYDEKCKWVLYADVLPCSRAMAVSAKYLTVCFSLLTCLVITGGTQVIRMAVLGRWDFVFLLQLCFLFITAGLTLPGFMLPVIFRVGTEKGRILYYVAIGILCAAAGVLSIEQTGTFQTWPLWISAIGAIILFVLSWLLSIRLYQKREL